MGLQIGQIPALLAGARPESRPAEAPRFEPDLVRSDTASQADANRDGAALFQGLGAETTTGSGLVETTVSGPAAALNALDGSVRAAREAIPTLDDIRAQFEIRRAQQEAVVAEQNEALVTRLSGLRSDAVSTIPEANPQALNRFTQALELTEPPALVEPQSPVPEFASAEVPEAPDFETAEAEVPEVDVEPSAGPVAQFFAQSTQGRFNLTA